jgi:hypothetical protein
MGQKPKHELTIDDITEKQRLFVETLIDSIGTKKKKLDIVKEVYGDPGKEMSDKSASAIGARLTNRKINPHVVMFLDKRRAEETAIFEKDRLRRYKRLEYLSNAASKKDQYNAAITAEYRSGQLAGMFVDKKEVRVSGLEGMSREELEKKLEELSKKIDGHNAKTIEVKL